MESCNNNKNLLEDSNTFYAQGGIASVSNVLDNFEKHITDTCIAGAGICNKKTVEKLYVMLLNKLESSLIGGEF